MSASERRALQVQVAIRSLHALARALRRSWRVFRDSRLGKAGLVIVLAFAVIGILAPVISPFPRNFEAPESDRFVVSVYRHDLLPNRIYNPPVLGPTTPLSSDKQGGMWVIDSLPQEGLILMDYVRGTLETRKTPFEIGNRSIRLDITQDFSLIPAPAPPLRSVYYIVPAKNSSEDTGPGIDNGAIAFFSALDFVVVDPFTRGMIFAANLGFVPDWTGEDPASAGQMLVLPIEEFLPPPFPGLPRTDVGAYRYFYAASPTHANVYEINYVHSRDPSPRSGRLVLSMDVNLSAPPFVYHDQTRVDSNDSFRSGTGQAILLPLVNGTIEIHNVTGALRGWFPVQLGGQPAVVSGSIGFTRTPSFPQHLYLPVKSASAIGLLTLDMATLRVVEEFSLPNPTWEFLGPASSYRGDTTNLALFDPADGASGTTHVIRLNETGVEIAQFRSDFAGRIRGSFEVNQLSRVFVDTADGDLVTLDTAFASSAHTVPEGFPIRPPSKAMVEYAGALGGTLYGAGLIKVELFAAWTEPTEGEVTLFQLLGTPIVPLPPDTYPSGNHYILGTDFRGGDILTQLFYGTQVAFIVGGLAALFAVGLGTLVGLIAGYYGKLVDTLLMRTTDIFLVLPFLPVVLVLTSIVSPSIWVIITVIGIVGWPGIARVIRAQVLSLKERPFIDAARVSGASDLRLIFYHIGPNVLPFSFLYMSLTVAGAIITEAALSFLGLGDPSLISWGGMLSQVLTFGGALTAWWWLLPPGLAITLLSLGFYLLGRGFDEIINPRLRRR